MGIGRKHDETLEWRCTNIGEMPGQKRGHTFLGGTMAMASLVGTEM